MTTMQPRELWSTMPGWGIVANLIPPELLQARRVRALQKLVGAFLCLLLVVAGAGTGYAVFRSHESAQSLAAEQTRTSQLIAQQNRYSNVTQIQGNVTQVRTQLATLMKMDVDSSALIDAMLKQLPAGAVVTQLALTIAEPTPTAANNAGASTLDTSGQPHIGTVTLSGQALTVPDVAVLVDRLSALKGVVDPYPTTNTVNDTGAQFTIQLSINDSLLSHRYALGSTDSSSSATGGN
ncbi:MAG: PilN domain-containing protein [Jatrophihabitantaceae bacterium]